MARSTRPLLLMLALVGGCAEPPSPATTPPAAAASASASIDDFFQRFTDEWVRRNPNLAISTRYFQGEEQDRLSREITPVSRAFELETIAIARRGLAELATFERGSLTPDQQLSADVMRWQLQNAVDSEPYLEIGRAHV